VQRPSLLRGSGLARNGHRHDARSGQDQCADVVRAKWQDPSKYLSLEALPQIHVRIVVGVLGFDRFPLPPLPYPPDGGRRDAFQCSQRCSESLY
jgi:hypothetical protein